MLPFIRSEVFRLVRRRMLWILFLFAVLLPIALYTIIYTSTNTQIEMIRSGRLPTTGAPGGQGAQLRQLEELIASLRPARLPEMAMGLVLPIATILAIVLAGNTTGNEFGWGTIRTVLAHGARRASFVLAKLLVLAGGAYALVVVGFVAALAGSLLVVLMGRGDASVAGDFVGRFLLGMAKVGFATLPYVAFAVMMAVLARSAAAGIGFGIALFFAESLIAQLAISLDRGLRAVFDAGIARNASTITRVSTSIEGVPPAALPSPAEAGFAYLILVMYVVAFSGIAVHRIAKRDVTMA